jgi:isochorismate hydrolase
MKENYLLDKSAAVCAREIIDKVKKYHRTREYAGGTNNSALLIVDMQNYFTDENSHAFIPASKGIVENINCLIDKFLLNTSPIIYTLHHNVKGEDNAMNRFWGGALEKDTNDYRLDSNLKIPDTAIKIAKQSYDAFYRTELESVLNRLGVTRLIICGVHSHLCVETTARVAFVRNYDVVLPVDCIASYLYEYHFASVLNLSHGVAKVCVSEGVK